jgi:hypothetical protein
VLRTKETKTPCDESRSKKTKTPLLVSSFGRKCLTTLLKMVEHGSLTVPLGSVVLNLICSKLLHEQRKIILKQDGNL